MTEINKKQVCTCKNCGNEAEMLIVCHLEDDSTGSTDAPAAAKEKKTGKAAGSRVKGRATCSHCGSEADIWLEL